MEKAGGTFEQNNKVAKKEKKMKKKKKGRKTRSSKKETHSITQYVILARTLKSQKI